MGISPPKPLPRGNETILLVEPEPETRKLAAFMLTKQGYQVIEARNAAEAVRIFEECSAPIDLLLTEAVMSGERSRPVADPDASFCPASGHYSWPIATMKREPKGARAARLRVSGETVHDGDSRLQGSRSAGCSGRAP